MGGAGPVAGRGLRWGGAWVGGACLELEAASCLGRRAVNSPDRSGRLSSWGSVGLFLILKLPGGTAPRAPVTLSAVVTPPP